MTDTQTAIADFANWHAARTARVDAEMQHLKQVLVPPLRQAGIATVEIRFDGYGDSGAIEEIDCRDAAGQAVVCPEVFLAIAPYDPEEPGEVRQETVQVALESLGYLALERHHPGWENNDGASGSLMIDVAEASFRLECSLRYTGYEDHSTGL